jgi:anti-anti-sigma factor
MQISSVQRDHVTLIRIQGNLDATTAQEAAARFAKEIEAGHINLVIDFGGVTYLSSAGVRAILAAMQDARTAGGDVRLAGAEGNIKRVIEMAGCSRIMKTFQAADDAVTSYTPS